jgi:uncharacterized membrane protein YphA (DoxX/SURF4 family)
MLRQLFQNKYFNFSIRFVLAAIFIYSALDKIDDRAGFIKIVNYYHLLPVSLVNIFAITLPWLELLTAIFLLVGKYVKAASLIYSALLVIFIIALFQAAVRGISINCGCFSLKGDEVSNLWLRIFQDFILLFLSINLYLVSPADESVFETQLQN